MIERKHIQQSDSLAFVRNPEQAKAALKLCKGIENGTAVIDTWGSAHADRNGGVFYRCLAGQVYPAEIVLVRGESETFSFVDLDVYPPGAEPVRLTRIRYQKAPA